MHNICNTRRIVYLQDKNSMITDDLDVEEFINSVLYQESCTGEQFEILPLSKWPAPHICFSYMLAYNIPMILDIFQVFFVSIIMATADRRIYNYTMYT